MFTKNEFNMAINMMKGTVYKTPLAFSENFSGLCNNQVYLKLENLQKTGSFKVRGAFNKIMSLSSEERSKGVIAASAGNHAQGVAFASSIANIDSTIVMPRGAALTKVEATKKYGAKVILHGETFDESLEFTRKLEEDTGSTFVHPFDDKKIIIGQGTIGLEILNQLPDLDAIICPIGGGGLISGIASLFKECNPKIKIYGVEAAAVPSMTQSLAAKKPVSIDMTSTIADGIAVKKPGELTFNLIQQYVDDIVTVNENEISQTMLHLLERNKLLVEGSGATPIAALLYHKFKMKGKKVVPIISGGNVDVNFISRLIEHGLVESGRYYKFSTIVLDRPGQLNKLLSILAYAEANILTVNHDRIGSHVALGTTNIEFTLETKSFNHIKQIKKALFKAGYSITEEM